MAPDGPDLRLQPAGSIAKSRILDIWLILSAYTSTIAVWHQRAMVAESCATATRQELSMSRSSEVPGSVYCIGNRVSNVCVMMYGGAAKFSAYELNAGSFSEPSGALTH